VALIGRCTQAAEELVQYGADIRIPAFMDKRSTPVEFRNHLLTVAYASVEQMVRIKLRHELKAVPLDLTLLDQCPKDGAKFGVLRKRHHCGCRLSPSFILSPCLVIFFVCYRRLWFSVL
jgi:hypothetical protein